MWLLTIIKFCFLVIKAATGSASALPILFLIWDHTYLPPTGMWVVGCIHYIGPRPYAMLFDPVGVINPTRIARLIQPYTIGISCGTHPGTTPSGGAPPGL